MTDFLTLRVTKREAEMIMDALHIVATAGGDRRGHDIVELNELHDDLFEQVARPDDWTDDVEPTEIAEGFSFSVTEDDFIDAGIRAREAQKASSRSATRRNERMMKGTAMGVDPDVWPLNDPVDW